MPDEFFPLLIGPYGALALAALVILGLYRLFQDERRIGREDRKAMVTLAEVVKDQTNEIRSLREGLARK